MGPSVLIIVSLVHLSTESYVTAAQFNNNINRGLAGFALAPPLHSYGRMTRSFQPANNHAHHHDANQQAAIDELNEVLRYLFPVVPHAKMQRSQASSMFWSGNGQPHSKPQHRNLVGTGNSVAWMMAKPSQQQALIGNGKEEDFQSTNSIQDAPSGGGSALSSSSEHLKSLSSPQQEMEEQSTAAAATAAAETSIKGSLETVEEAPKHFTTDTRTSQQQESQTESEFSNSLESLDPPPMDAPQKNLFSGSEYQKQHHKQPPKPISQIIHNPLAGTLMVPQYQLDPSTNVEPSTHQSSSSRVNQASPALKSAIHPHSSRKLSPQQQRNFENKINNFLKQLNKIKTNQHRQNRPLETTTPSLGKRGPECMRKCIMQGELHPVQCHSLC